MSPKHCKLASKLTQYFAAFFNTGMQFFHFGEPEQFERSLQQTPEPFPSVYKRVKYISSLFLAPLA